MSYTDWLRRQTSRLEEEIRTHVVFEDGPATPVQLRELRIKVVIHTWLKQQLLRRETIATVAEEYDTQEFVLVRRA